MSGGPHAADSVLELKSADVVPDEGAQKIADALERFTLVEALTEASWERGFAALWKQFGPLNEIERHEVLHRWFSEGSLQAPTDPVRARYHMVLAFDRDGQLAAVRDGFSAVDASARRVVCLLSHSLVLPAFRRSGVALLLRAAPAVLARRDARWAGLRPEAAEVLLVAEMEHVVPSAKDSVVRLIAYGRAGFRAVRPADVPYAQPDFRDGPEMGPEGPKPLPFSLLVRQVGHEDRETLAASSVEAIVRHLQVIHSTAVVPSQLPLIRSTALGPITRSSLNEVPVMRLPRTSAAVAELAPLLQAACLPHYPPAWWPVSELGEPGDELARLVASWGPPSPTQEAS